MFSFRRLRHLQHHFLRHFSICVPSAPGSRQPVATHAAARSMRRTRSGRQILSSLAATFLAGSILVGSMLAPAVLRAQDPAAAPPAPTSGQSDSSSAQTGQAQTNQDQAGQPQQETPGQISVQERIRQRRAQRRATAIHDAYDQLFESYAGMGYLRFQPGASLQRTTFYGWNTGVTRYLNERLGVDVDARGYYGIAYTGLQQGVTNAANTRPKISEYNVMAGPTYRFYLQPKYSISGRVLGGFALGNFSSDTNGFGSTSFGIWPDAVTYAAAGSLIGQYNWSPGLSVRLTGEDFLTGFGSTTQNSFGFTAGFVYRFGKR
jgi:hypothetical protein